MRKRLVSARDWLYERAALDTDPLTPLRRRLPRGIGWPQTLGAVAMLLLVIVGLTGVLLAMYYSPHPDAAYESMVYVDRRLPLGNLVRGIHYYATGALLIVLALHLIRTFVHAAYKRPRELVWVTGVIVLLVTMGFVFTGELLPWDQKAYWSARVRGGFAAGVPGLGPVLQRLLLGGPEVGALTLTRFYALHAVLLPMILLPLLGLHVWLAARAGHTVPGSRVGEKPTADGPTVSRQVLREALAGLAVVAVVFLLSVLRPVELEFKANPADPTYSPHPDWNLIFLYQFLRDFANIPVIGSIQWVGAVVIPGIATTVLLLVPWLDRGPDRRPSRRPLMMAGLAFGVLGVVGFTVRAYALLHPNATPSNSLYAHVTDGGRKALDAALVAEGRQAFAMCGGCHAAYNDYRGRTARDLSGYGLTTFLSDPNQHPRAARLTYWDRFEGFVRGPLQPDGIAMPDYTEGMLPDPTLRALAAYLSQDPRSVAVLRHKDPKE
ncbi:MAG: cytochrome b [Armatimonadota bacterium]